MRKHTLEYDDVMNRQRMEIYSFRNELLNAKDPIQIASEILESAALQVAEPLLSKSISSKDWNPEALRQTLMHHFPVHFEERSFSTEIGDIKRRIIEKVVDALKTKLHLQRQNIAAHRPDMTEPEKYQEILQEVIRSIMLRRVDQLWQDHLLSVDHLRSDVHMRTVGQKDPLLEFKHESFELFKSLSEKLHEEISRDLFRFEMMPPQLPPEQRLKKTLAAIQEKQRLSLKSSDNAKDLDTALVGSLPTQGA